MTNSSNNVAVLADVENIVFSLRNRFGVDVNFNDIMARCRDYGRVKIARAYGQWDEKFLVREIQWLNNCGFDLMHVPASAHKANGYTNKSKPNIVDIYMTVDAMRVLAEDESISTFVLLTGDGDFIPLVNAIKRAGKKVVAVGVDRCWSDNLESAVDEFLAYSQISPASIGLIDVDDIDLDNRVVEIVKTMRAQGHDMPSLHELSEWLKTSIEGFDDRRLINSENWYYRDLRAYLMHRLGPKGYQIRKKKNQEFLLSPDSEHLLKDDAQEPEKSKDSEKEKPKSKGRKGQGDRDHKRRKGNKSHSKKPAPQKTEAEDVTPAAEVEAEAAPVEKESPVVEAVAEVVAPAIETPAPAAALPDPTPVAPKAADPVVEEATDKLTIESAQALLLEAVTKLAAEGRNPRASIVKLTMRRLNSDFSEKDFRNSEGQRFAKFDQFLLDAEKSGLVRLEGEGVYREVYLPENTGEVNTPEPTAEAEVDVEPDPGPVEATVAALTVAAVEAEEPQDLPAADAVEASMDADVAPAVEPETETVAAAEAVEAPEVEDTDDVPEVVAVIETEDSSAPIHATDDLSIEYVSTEDAPTADASVDPEIAETPEVEAVETADMPEVAEVIEDAATAVEEDLEAAAETLAIPPVNEVVVLDEADEPVVTPDLPPFLVDKEQVAPIEDTVVETPAADAVEMPTADEADSVVEDEVAEDDIQLPGAVTQQFQLREKIKAIENELGSSITTQALENADAPVTDTVDTAVDSATSAATGIAAAGTAAAAGLLSPLGEGAADTISTGLSSITDGLSSITEKFAATPAPEEELPDIFEGVEESQELTVEEIEAIMQVNDEPDSALIETTLNLQDDLAVPVDSAISDKVVEETRELLADEEVKRQVVMWMNGYNNFPATIDDLKLHCQMLRDEAKQSVSDFQVSQLVLDAVMAGILQMEPSSDTPALYNLNITKDTVAAYLERGK